MFRRIAAAIPSASALGFFHVTTWMFAGVSFVGTIFSTPESVISWFAAVTIAFGQR
jgi:hypothetical protein